MKWLGVLAVAIMAVTGCTDDDDAGDSGAAVFDADADDLCEWVTGEELVESLTDAGWGVQGPATAGDPASDDLTGWDCAWGFASGEELQLGIRQGSLGEEADVVVYAGPGQIMENIGLSVIGHPALSDGVVVENAAFLRFLFYAPGLDHRLNVTFISEQSGNEDTYEETVMTLADDILVDLGWIAT